MTVLNDNIISALAQESNKVVTTAAPVKKYTRRTNAGDDIHLIFRGNSQYGEKGTVAMAELKMSDTSKMTYSTHDFPAQACGNTHVSILLLALNALEKKLASKENFDVIHLYTSIDVAIKLRQAISAAKAGLQQVPASQNFKQKYPVYYYCVNCFLGMLYKAREKNVMIDVKSTQDIYTYDLDRESGSDVNPVLEGVKVLTFKDGVAEVNGEQIKAQFAAMNGTFEVTTKNERRSINGELCNVTVYKLVRATGNEAINKGKKMRDSWIHNRTLQVVDMKLQMAIPRKRVTENALSKEFDQTMAQFKAQMNGDATEEDVIEDGSAF